MDDWRVHPRKKKKAIPSTAKQATKASLALSSKSGTPPEFSAAGRALQARRMVSMTAKERTRVASNAAAAYWAQMSEKERKIEMRRRSKVSKKRRLAARREKIRAGK